MILSFKEQFVTLIQTGKKIHTIREDKPNRWKPGMEIHFWKGNPRNIKHNPYPFEHPYFNKCESIQRISIDHNQECVEINIDNDMFFWVFPRGDNVYGEYSDQFIEFINNDGFNSVDEFFLFFNKDFNGKIIHWTTKRY